MKRLWKRALVGLAVVAICILNYRDWRSYQCQVCFSRRDDYQWRIGEWGSLSAPITPTSSHLKLSGFAKDFALTNHQHQWMFAQESPYYVFGTVWGGCGLGGGRHTSDLVRTYETNRKFRKYVSDEIVSGRISTSRFVELASCLDREDTVLRKQAEEFLDAYYGK